MSVYVEPPGDGAAVEPDGSRASAGLAECLEALKPHWRRLNAEALAFNAAGGVERRGVGIACSVRQLPLAGSYSSSVPTDGSTVASDEWYYGR